LAHSLSEGALISPRPRKRRLAESLNTSHQSDVDQLWRLSLQ